ncbi:MAG: GNAT family N-acetyltransferase [Alphaproteobacteria bacterium]|nr:GNAT family N-acetyltransferase [Alphaproteobacteria bacterium]
MAGRNGAAGAPAVLAGARRPRAGSAVIEAGAAHATLLSIVHGRCFAPGWDETEMAALLAMPGTFALVAPDDEPAGFVLARQAADEAEIVILCVLPEARGAGLGRRLLDSTIDRLRADGAASLFLEVARNNMAALRLYEGFGFVQVGLRPRYYGDAVDALVLRLNL